MAISLAWPQTQSGWQTFLQSTGLVPDVAARALYLAWYAKQLMGVQIQIESAYRSPEYQRELQRKWDAGIRAGLKSRPADSSLHSQGRAFDVSIVGPAPANAWANLGSLGEAFGLRWGGTFSDPDPVHFDL